jgi:hypothetical protein
MVISYCVVYLFLLIHNICIVVKEENKEVERVHFFTRSGGGHQREQNKLKEPMSNSRGLKRPTSLEAALGLFQRSIP